MKTAEVLARLDAARELLSAFPPDVDVLSLEITEYRKCIEKNTIQLYESWQKLIDSHIIDPAAVRTNTPHGKKWAKEVSVRMKGFDLFQLTDKKEATLGAVNAGDDNERN